MKVDIKDSIYELVETGEKDITVRCKIDGREEIWVPVEVSSDNKTYEDSVYELVVDGTTYRYDHAKVALVVAAALKAIKQARTAANAHLMDAAAKNLRSILASVEPLVKAPSRFGVSASIADSIHMECFTACEGDSVAEQFMEGLHKSGSLITTLLGQEKFPASFLEKSSEAFQAAWKKCLALVEEHKTAVEDLPIAPAAVALEHNDIVEFKADSPYARDGYFRVDTEDAVGATPQKPWIGDLAQGQGWYVDSSELRVVLSSQDFETRRIRTEEEVLDLLEEEEMSEEQDMDFDSSKTAAAGDPYGVRWQEFNRQDRIVTKEKFFPSEAAREKFANELEKRDNFKAFDAWTDPAEEETHEASPAAEKFEVNCVGADNKIIWSKKAPTKKMALSLISEAKKTEAIHIELIDQENRTWYYDRKSSEDKWSAPVEM